MDSFLELLQSLSIDIIGGVVATTLGFLLSSLVPLISRTLSERSIGSKRAKVTIGTKEVTLSSDREETLKRLYAVVTELQEHPRVFISHSASDVEFAKRLADDLRSNGINPWLADEQIALGDSVVNRIEEGIDTSQWVIVLISDEALESEYLEREIVFALKSEERRDRILIIPVLHQGDKMPPILKERKFADFRTDYDGGLQSLIARIKSTHTVPTR